MAAETKLEPFGRRSRGEGWERDLAQCDVTMSRLLRIVPELGDYAGHPRSTSFAAPGRLRDPPQA
jgi:hypothetical protein